MRTMQGKKRRGAAAVEMAIVTPVLLTFLFGIIEFGWMFSIKNTLVNAAREGARFGALEGTTVDEIEAVVVDALEPMGLSGKATINVVEPSEDDPIVTVTASVTQSQVSLVGNYFGTWSGTISGTASMRREGN